MNKTTSEIKTLFSNFKVYTYNDTIPNFILKFTNLNPWIAFSTPMWNTDLNCVCFHTNNIEDFQKDDEFNSKLGVLE